MYAGPTLMGDWPSELVLPSASKQDLMITAAVDDE